MIDDIELIEDEFSGKKTIKIPKEIEVDDYILLDNNYIIVNNNVYTIVPYENNMRLFGATVTSPTTICSNDDKICYFSKKYTFELRKIIFYETFKENKLRELLKLLSVIIELPSSLERIQYAGLGVNKISTKIKEIEELATFIDGLGVYTGKLDTYDVIKFINDVFPDMDKLNPYSIDSIVMTSMMTSFISFKNYDKGVKGHLYYYKHIDDKIYAHASITNETVNSVNDKLKGIQVERNDNYAADFPILNKYYEMAAVVNTTNNIQLLGIFSAAILSEQLNTGTELYTIGAREFDKCVFEGSAYTNKTAITNCLYALAKKNLGKNPRGLNRRILLKNFANFIFKICLKSYYSVSSEKLMVSLKRI